MNKDALRWLDQHWTPEFLPNNKWIVVSGTGILAEVALFNEVIEQKQVQQISLEEIVFCFVTFDIWQ